MSCVSVCSQIASELIISMHMYTKLFNIKLIKKTTKLRVLLKGFRRMQKGNQPYCKAEKQSPLLRRALAVSRCTSRHLSKNELHGRVARKSCYCTGATKQPTYNMPDSTETSLQPSGTQSRRGLKPKLNFIHSQRQTAGAHLIHYFLYGIFLPFWQCSGR